MIGLPRSLRGRTLLLTVVGIVACECLTFAILGIYRHNLLAGRARDFVTGQIDTVQAALAHATPQQVARELERGPPPRPREPRPADGDRPFFRFDGGLRGGGPRGEPPHPRPMSRMRLVESPPSNATRDPPSDSGMPSVVAALRQEFGEAGVRFTGEPNPAMWVLTAPDGWWLMLPFARYSAPAIPWQILFATLAAVGAMGGLVALYSFHLSKPLRALAEAAGGYRVGHRRALPLTGPDEIQAVTAQFNAMVERLEQDDAERRVMLAGLPHDLRAPLARAKLRLELMDDGPDSPKAGLARDLAEVGRIADQFVAYLRGLDHDTSGFRPTALHELVRDRGLVWRESGHDIAIGQADATERPADADALMRAVDNLVGNAFAHGRPPVVIEGIAGDDAYRIVVRDHGPGIPAERRDEALKPFARLDAARGTSGHCGLGLAVAHAVARLHGGTVALDDAPGGGLAAAVVLPTVTTPS